jgi:dihydroxyacid dehydratase/phosphogluconate dehydratase
MKRLLDAKLLHGDCMTVTGRTLAENLRDVADYPQGQDIVRPLSEPIKKDSHLVVMYGNLAPEGAVAKISGKEGLRFAGSARVFDGEERATQAILAGKVKPGDVVVIRNEGPRGGPGMREMLSPTGAIMGRGLGDKVALITDGRFSGGSHGFVVGHISPEAALGGPIGLLRDGDRIAIDAVKRSLEIDLSVAEMEGAQTVCDERCAGEVRAECVQRIARRRDRLTVKSPCTIRAFAGLGQTQLLSVPAAAVTVRRLWTGAEAKNVNSMIRMVLLAKLGQTGGRNEERLHWWGSLVTFRHPV